MTDLADTSAETDAQALQARAGWEGILDPGETITWQGRPDQSLHVEAKEIPGAIFALFFSGFAVFWMTKAASFGGAFWMFGLIHFSVGLGIFWSSLFGPTRRRRSTWYTLTDRRAFIATDTPRKGRELNSYPISPGMQITLRRGPPDTIHFAREQRTGSKGRRYTVPIGFERIPDGEEVMALLRNAQRRTADT